MTEEVQVKIGKERIIFAVAIVIIAVFFYFSYPMFQNIYNYTVYSLFPITKYNYHGTMLEFRSDLKEAQKIPVYPYEGLITSTVFEPLAQNLTIEFQSTSQNDLVAVDGYEIAYKMRIAYLTSGSNITITSKMVNSTDYGSPIDIVVMLVPPVLTNETSVRVGNFTVIISGKTPQEFDQAVDKFLMVAMGIKV